jgi:hypothetical protein
MQENQEVQERLDHIYRFYVFYKYFSMFLFFVFALPRIMDLAAYNQKNPVVSQPSLSVGVAGNLNIKAVTYDKDEEVVIRKERLVKAQWAKLELWPTIGCAKPTLVYLDGNSHLTRLVVDGAKIIQ